MTLPIRKVTPAGWSRGRESMGTLVDEGLMEKSYVTELSNGTRTIVWHLKEDANIIVDNGHDPLIHPGDTVEWPK